MNATSALPIVGVDLAKSVFQLAIADVRAQHLQFATVSSLW